MKDNQYNLFVPSIARSPGGRYEALGLAAGGAIGWAAVALGALTTLIIGLFSGAFFWYPLVAGFAIGIYTLVACLNNALYGTDVATIKAWQRYRTLEEETRKEIGLTQTDLAIEDNEMLRVRIHQLADAQEGRRKNERAVASRAPDLIKTMGELQNMEHNMSREFHKLARELNNASG